jgi:RHS repeat-associated protein
MLTADKEETLSAPMVWTDECVLPLAASGVYSKTRVRGSNPENMHYSRATAPLKIELRWGCENSSEKTAVGSGVTFKYDPLGRRIEKSSSAATSVFAYDGNNLVEETNSSGAVVARYAQTENIDESLAMLRSSTTSYYQADGLGSVTSLSNSAGALGQTYSFDSFGKQTASAGSLVNPFQYTGRELDSETGLYYYRARYYDPQAGRFLGEDPIRWFSGAANFYGYVHNDPVDLIDPLGLRATKAATADCIAKGLQALFPGVTATVGTATKEIGGHWNFSVQLQFSSYDAANAFFSAYTTSTTNGWYPPARFGSGPALHLENLGGWSLNGDTRSIAGTAHIDLYNPNGTSQGGGGLGGLAGHVGIDGVVGPLVQIFHSNIDPANCPWGSTCSK